MTDIQKMIKERRKFEIAEMSRKELNAHAYLLEQEQEEYENTTKHQQELIEQLHKEYAEERSAHNSHVTELIETQKVIKQKDAEIKRLQGLEDGLNDFADGYLNKSVNELVGWLESTTGFKRRGEQ